MLISAFCYHITNFSDLLDVIVKALDMMGFGDNFALDAKLRAFAQCFQ